MNRRQMLKDKTKSATKSIAGTAGSVASAAKKKVKQAAAGSELPETASDRRRKYRDAREEAEVDRIREEAEREGRKQAREEWRESARERYTEAYKDAEKDNLEREVDVVEDAIHTQNKDYHEGFFNAKGGVGNRALSGLRAAYQNQEGGQDENEQGNPFGGGFDMDFGMGSMFGQPQEERRDSRAREQRENQNTGMGINPDAFNDVFGGMGGFGGEERAERSKSSKSNEDEGVDLNALFWGW